MKDHDDVEEQNGLLKEYLEFLTHNDDDPADTGYEPHDSVTLCRVTSFLKFHVRKINTNGVTPLEFKQLPWVDSYHLIANDSGDVWPYSDKFSGSAAKANENLRKKLRRIISDRLHFVHLDISHHAHAIVGWKKFSYKCSKSPLHHRIFNGCCRHGEPDWYERSSCDYAGMDYLGALTVDEHSFLIRSEMSCHPNCDCCEKPMKLLYSFMPAMKGSSIGREILHGLFYCEDSGRMRTSCIDHRKD